MTCRDDILEAVRALIRQKGVNEFTAHEVVEYMRAHGTTYKENTIRTHITTGLMTINAAKHHSKTHDDFERTADGVYRLSGG